MKQCIVQINSDGHGTLTGCGGVVGDHNATTLRVILNDPPEAIGYYRLLFAHDEGVLISEQLSAVQGVLCYDLPREVTGLGTSLCLQVLGYAADGEEVSVLFKSDLFPMNLGSALPDTADIVSGELTDRLNAMLTQVEGFYTDFDLSVDEVTTLPYDEPAQATLTRDGYAFSLELAVPRGQPGQDFDWTVGDGLLLEDKKLSLDPDAVQAPLTAGTGITISGNVISAQSAGGAKVYKGVENLYEYIGIEDNRSMSELKGTFFLVDPIYDSDSGALSLFTTSERVYYSVYRYTKDGLNSSFPAGAVKAGRIMVLAVTESGKIIYLNPDMEPEMPLPGVCKVTVAGVGTSFPLLNLSLNDSYFAGGKQVYAVCGQDIPLDGTSWYGPMLCSYKIYTPSGWVSTNAVTDKVLKAGTPFLLYMDYDPQNYCYRTSNIIPLSMQDQ